MTASNVNVRQMAAAIALIRKGGVDVREMPGWQDRGRSWGFGPWRGAVIHHDASTIKSGEWGALGYIMSGSPIAPLSQLQGARCLDGIPKVAVVAAGGCNHAGVGYHPAVGNRGNSLLVGVEWAGTTGEAYTPAALHARRVVLAALLEVAEDGSPFLIAHKEWATPRGRKSDPEGSMDALRRDVEATRRQLRAGKTQPVKPVEPAPGMAEYPVQKGDTLRNIAERAYGDDDLWEFIADSNPKTLQGKTTIAPGMTLWLPTDVPEEYLMPSAAEVAEATVNRLLATPAGAAKIRVEYLLAGTNTAAHAAKNGVTQLARAVAEQGKDPDPDAFARRVAPALVPLLAEPIAQAVAETVGGRDGLSADEIAALAERVVRKVFGELDRDGAA